MDKLVQVAFHAIPTPSFNKDVWSLESPVRSPVSVPVDANYLVFEVMSDGPGTLTVSQTTVSNHSLTTTHPTVPGTNRIVVPILVQVSHIFLEPQPWLVLMGVEAGVPEETTPYVPCVSASVYQGDSLVRTQNVGQYEFRTRLETMSVSIVPTRDCLASVVSQYGIRIAVPGYSGLLLGRARIPVCADTSIVAILPPKNFLAVHLERNDQIAQEDYLVII